MTRTIVNTLVHAVSKYGIIALTGKENVDRGEVLRKVTGDFNGVFLDAPTVTLNPEDYKDKEFIVINDFHINSHLNPVRLMQFFGKPLVIVANHFFAEDFSGADIPVYNVYSDDVGYDFEMVG